MPDLWLLPPASLPPLSMSSDERCKDADALTKFQAPPGFGTLCSEAEAGAESAYQCLDERREDGRDLRHSLEAARQLSKELPQLLHTRMLARFAELA